MRIDVCTRHVYRHVHRHVYIDVYIDMCTRHVHRHVYIDMCTRHVMCVYKTGAQTCAQTYVYTHAYKACVYRHVYETCAQDTCTVHRQRLFITRIILHGYRRRAENKDAALLELVEVWPVAKHALELD